ncbi:BadF/BadG/BcrA/BcrD ATPase family protein [Botrimarina mediterranea]|uniref:BadF/BadG/BcrA/BcrD ATPase family protein n=1 Tax=Botrimarina mediterranea TaxID=2528022 RepID=A0A518K6V4_9BACT|nr:BadF/BadG/BcrA/BcrD ATPase family protein [Botrimarina mediterranea]QDV73532.1 BadF/BadG/BcrA/BcrD ATPase family protein [Botrimarina mediterranea]QDV78123.1 BadF/BadG/BcrA/BcrD ATPase family protein [Planctomycetes bacterium K2D]
MKHVLGVDGGGTKTTARVLGIGPNGRLCLLASGHAGGSNPLSVGRDASHAAVSAAIKAAADGAGVPIDAAVIAVAGCGSPAAQEQLEAWAESQAFALQTKVVPDTEPLLADVPAGDVAIGLIAGTGSAALVRGPNGATELVGGWGYLIDDAGSGYTIGRDALRHVAQRWDRGESADALSEAILQHAGIESESPLALKGSLYGGPDPRGWTATLARIVLGLAEKGDPAAQRIVADNAAALTQLATYAASRIGPSDRPRIALAGGVVLGSCYYRHLLFEQLTAAGWRRDQITLAADAACACGLLAARLC